MIPETFGELTLGFLVFVVITLGFSVAVLLGMWIADKFELVDPPEGELVTKEVNDE